MRRGIELLADVVHGPSDRRSAGASVFEDGVSLAFPGHQPLFPATVRSSPSSVIS